jgi:hypothetical protein
MLQRFTSVGQAHRCVSTCGPLREHWCPRRQRMQAADSRREWAQRFPGWNTGIGQHAAAERTLLITRRTAAAGLRPP